jgi:hypothetical protein
VVAAAWPTRHGRDIGRRHFAPRCIIVHTNNKSWQCARRSARASSQLHQPLRNLRRFSDTTTAMCPTSRPKRFILTMGASHEFQVRNSALILHKSRNRISARSVHRSAPIPKVDNSEYFADSYSRLMIHLKVRLGGLLLDDSTNTQFRTGAKGKAVLNTQSDGKFGHVVSTQLCNRW